MLVCEECRFLRIVIPSAAKESWLLLAAPIRGSASKHQGPSLRSDDKPRKLLALRCYRRPRRLGNCARHGCDSCTLRRSLSRRCGRLRLGRSRNQSQCLAHFGIELGHGVFVIFEELARIFPSLADALALI